MLVRHEKSFECALVGMVAWISEIGGLSAAASIARSSSGDTLSGDSTDCGYSNTFSMGWQKTKTKFREGQYLGH